MWRGVEHLLPPGPTGDWRFVVVAANSGPNDLRQQHRLVVEREKQRHFSDAGLSCDRLRRRPRVSVAQKQSLSHGADPLAGFQRRLLTLA